MEEKIETVLEFVKFLRKRDMIDISDTLLIYVIAEHFEVKFDTVSGMFNEIFLKK